MYSVKSGLIITFHGCDAEVCNAIVKGAPFKPSENDYDWLGHRMYFWEYNEQRALEFAIEQKNNPRHEGQIIITPAVLGAVLDLKHCLDLSDSKYLDLVRNSYDNLAYSYELLGKDLPINSPVKSSNDKLLRRLDCAVIENLHALLDSEPFDSVKGIFVEGEPLYEGAGFNTKNHIQICIRNPNCIKAFFYPRKLEVWPVKKK